LREVGRRYAVSKDTVAKVVHKAEKGQRVVASAHHQSHKNING
jgi:hypothetical protein